MKTYSSFRCRALRLFSLALICFLLTACAGETIESLPSNQTTAVTTAEDEVLNQEDDVEQDTDKIRLLNKEGKAAYRIVRPANGTEADIIASHDLRKMLKELTSVVFTVSMDSLRSDHTLDDVAQVYEILLGATNRPETKQAQRGLGYDEYIVRVTEYKIVIVGGSNAATYKALQVFIGMLDENSNFTLAKDTNIKASLENHNYLVALTNHRTNTLEVYDISSGKLSESTLMWSYRCYAAGTKFRHSNTYGDVALACGGSQGYMISYPEGELLWQTSEAANNAHSIELMPNGVIAIASSTGGEVRFFTTDSSEPAAAVILGDAHGVLWDEQNQILWATGSTLLTAYRVTLNPNGTVTVIEDTDRRARMSSPAAHDLSPVYGDPNALWITTATRVYRFNKTTKTFSLEYDGNESLNTSNVKGVGNFDDGSIVFIYPDGKHLSWTSKSMFFLRNVGGRFIKEQLVSETGDFYKVRVWDTRYQ